MKNELGCKTANRYYVPKAVDTTGVVLSDEVLAMCEALAMNAHNMWAIKKMAEGFTYGDGEKQSPFLKPYSLLAESEKQGNRTTVLEPIKVLVLMGFSVIAPQQVLPIESQTIETFDPKCIDIFSVKIDAELEAAVDAIAFNAHEVWSIDRLQNGWIWAETRDNNQKHHPLLKPYEELSESDKSYDKDLAFGTLKAIVAIGGSIVKN